MAIIRTRVADDTWVFTSELYLEVNAGLVVTEEGGILIDTLPFPSETKQIIDFASRVCPQGIRYVINTVAHADHVYGSYLLPDAELVAHEQTFGFGHDVRGVLDGIRGTGTGVESVRDPRRATPGEPD